jgi:ABC-2 type transport system ATP-binding protein
MAPALEIRGLRKSFPTFALGPLDITVPHGAIYGFVGPNGAGKTTTIDLVFGLGAKDAGSIRVFGLDHLRDEVAMKAQVGYVGPDLNFRPWKRVGRAIQFVRGFYPGWDQEYCDRLLSVFKLATDDTIATLSFGARIKLSLVLALAWRPRLLILDEPTVGLDAIAKQEVFSELLAAVRDGERSVLISSHAISDLERFADHVGMINDGRMLFEGAIDEVLEHYRMVEFMSDRTLALESEPGISIQRRDGDRWRVLLDLRRSPISRLTERGVVPISESPLSLEELFVALGRG